MSFVFCASEDLYPSSCNTIRSNFNADISKWNTASVTTLFHTFNDATSFTGDGVSNWDTSSVTDYRGHSTKRPRSTEICQIGIRRK